MSSSNVAFPISQKFLLVEDSRIIQELTQKVLSFFTKGELIMKANNGEEALQMVKNESEVFKTIFLDFAMPVMDGIEFVHNLRRLGNKKAATTVIALTGNQENLSEEELKESGVNAAFIKPVNFNMILQKLPEIPTLAGRRWFGMLK